MKRSDAVLMLSDFLNDLRQIEGLTNEEMASDIIDIMKDIGMLPPLADSAGKTINLLCVWDSENFFKTKDLN